MFQELHDFESKMSKKEEEEEKRYLCTVNDLCSVQLFQWDKPQTHKKKLQKNPQNKSVKKISLLLTGCFVSMFLVCTFLVFILIVQLKLESCNEQKK